MERVSRQQLDGFWSRGELLHIDAVWNYGATHIAVRRPDEESLSREVADGDEHVDATGREPQQSARRISPYFHTMNDEKKWNTMERRDRSSDWQKVNVTADDSVESFGRGGAEHVTEISDLSACALCTIGKLSRKPRW